MQLALRERLAYEPMHLVTAGEDDRRRNAQPCRETGVALRERAEQEIDHQRNLGRQSGIVLPAVDVAHHGGEPDKSERDRRRGDAAHAPTDPAGQPNERKRANSSCAAVDSLAFASLPLDAKQQSDAERSTGSQPGICHRRRPR